MEGSICLNHFILKKSYIPYSVQRTYALNDEKGLLCLWPEGGRPKLTFVYQDEVWTGIEYQVAAHLIYEGFVDEGLTMVKAVRERHDGYRQNPWNGVECGHHYARSMPSWALLTALSGFTCDMVNKKMRFSPKNKQGRFFNLLVDRHGMGDLHPEATGDDNRLEGRVEVLYGELKDVEIVVDQST